MLPSVKYYQNGDSEPAQVGGIEAGDPRAESVAAGLEPAVPEAARLEVEVRGCVAQAAEQIAQEIRLSLSDQVRDMRGKAKFV